MEHCTHKQSCALFPILRASKALAYWTSAYCDGDHQRCARFDRMLRGDPPPANLLPNGKLLEV